MLMRARCRIGLINRYLICFDPREAKNLAPHGANPAGHFVSNSTVKSVAGKRHMPGHPRVTNGVEADPKEARRKVETARQMAKEKGWHDPTGRLIE